MQEPTGIQSAFPSCGRVSSAGVFGYLSEIVE